MNVLFWDRNFCDPIIEKMRAYHAAADADRLARAVGWATEVAAERARRAAQRIGVLRRREVVDLLVQQRVAARARLNFDTHATDTRAGHARGPTHLTP